MALPSELSSPPFPEGKLRLWLAEFSDAARKYPDSLAVAVLQQPAMLYGVPNMPLNDEEYLAHPHLRWSFASLESAIERLVDGLQAAGVKKGAVVFTFLLNSVEHLLVTYAAHTIGCVLVPLNPRSLKVNRVEVKYQIETTLAAADQHGHKPVVFTETDELAREIDGMKPLLHHAVKIFVSPRTPDKTRGQWSTFADLMRTSDGHSNGSNSLEKAHAPPSSPQKSSGGGKRRLGRLLRLIRSTLTCGRFRPPPGDETNTATSNGTASASGQDYADDVILFTSGSTARPKALWHRHPTYKAVFMHRRGHADNQSGPGSVFCCAVPNNHSIGHYWPQSFLALGSAVVYPGGRSSAGEPSSSSSSSPASIPQLGDLFDPALVLRAMVRERVTHTTLVPTMVFALANTLTGSSSTAAEALRPRHLVSVMTGGANCTPEAARLCVEVLGALGVENLYGMTEGIIISGSSQRDVGRIFDDDQTHVSVGSVVPGDGVRIADVETGAVLPRGAWGEVHVSGPGLRPYVGAAGVEANEAYYTDAGRLWYKTGDRGKMDGDGRIFLEGRYKEMIIRGGENISPVVIESVLSKDPKLSSLHITIVGAPDKLVGEVPVAVVKGPAVEPETRQAVHDTILKHMGVMYLPDEVIAVRQLEGLSEVDLTAAAGGKVPRRKITAAVARFRAEQEGGDGGASGSEKEDDAELAAVLRDIWARASGILPEKLPFYAPTGEFADSLTLIRVRDTILRRTGRNLAVGDMIRAGSIAAQLKLLQSTAPQPGPLVSAKGTSIKKAPPTVDDIEFLQADPTLFSTTKTIIESTIAPFGLEWGDVSEVFSSYDFADVLQDNGIMDSLQWRFFYSCKTANKEQLRMALEVVLANNPLWTSFLIKTPALLDSGGIHVTIEPTPKMMNLIIDDGGTAATVAQLSALCPNYPFPEKALLPGPTIHFMLYDIAETGAAGFVFNVHHMVQDASYHWVVMEDLDTALLAISGGGPVPRLRPHVPYKLWADAYYTQRTSPRARAVTRWQVDRLRDLPRHAARAIPFRKSARRHVLPDDGSSRYGEGAGLRVFAAPGLRTLRRTHPRITATTVVHAAIVLLSVHITGHSHAVTFNFEAARGTLPFLPPALAAGWAAGGSGVKDASDVAGPTWDCSLFTTEVAGTTLELLGRMQDEQDAATAHAVVPLREVATALGLSLLRDGDDGDGAEAGTPNLAQILRGCFGLNWVPGLGAQVAAGDERFRCIQQVHSNIKPRGIFPVSGLAGDGETVIINLVGDAVDDTDRERLVEDMKKIVLWMTTEENWESPVSGFASALGS